MEKPADKKVKYYEFIPEKDITIVELAAILQATGLQFAEHAYNSFPEEIKRHFR